MKRNDARLNYLQAEMETVSTYTKSCCHSSFPLCSTNSSSTRLARRGTTCRCRHRCWADLPILQLFCNTFFQLSETVSNGGKWALQPLHLRRNWRLHLWQQRMYVYRWLQTFWRTRWEILSWLPRMTRRINNRRMLTIKVGCRDWWLRNPSVILGVEKVSSCCWRVKVWSLNGKSKL